MDAVSLVPLARVHLDRTREWANDAKIMRLMDRTRIVSTGEHEAWFAALARRRDCLYFAIEAGTRHVGNVWLAGIDAHHRKAEVRIVVGESDARERGVGSRAIDLMSVYGFERLDLH